MRLMAFSACFLVLTASAAWAEPDYSAADRIMEDYRLDAHLPGMVFGVVQGGKLVHVLSAGVQDLDSNRPVTPDSLFRIASMTKAFTALTILKLRDDGALRLDGKASDYVPELQGWSLPTADSPSIRLRDLLSHVAGFVTDDPWGDRQTPMKEADFTRFLESGVPFTRAPETAFEYSNLGFALLGRTITNVSKQPFEVTIGKTLLTPLGMSASGFIATEALAERRTQGYRWENSHWRPEPLLGPGAFGAMGGLQTSANDYARWVGFLLSAWPPRDEADQGPVKRATVRELAQGLNFPRTRTRPSRSGGDGCRQAVTYGMGMIAATDCDLGFNLSHGGGYPGFGSYVLLFPERGVGLFAFANRTYAGPAPALWDAAIALEKSGALPAPRPVPVSAEAASAYKAIAAIYQAGDLKAGGDMFAMNFLLDRDEADWNADLVQAKSQSGECEMSAPLMPTGALTASFSWRCAHGRIRGSFELAPTKPAKLQQLELAPARP